MLDHPLLVLGLLLLVIFGSEWLVQRTWVRQLGTALLVIVLGAILANLGAIPTASDQYPLYRGIFTYLAPLSLFFLMLEINLRDLRQAGLPMLVMFLLGGLGTVLGVWLALTVAVGPEAFGEYRAALAGMFAGTYIGGAVNFNAVALPYRVMESGNLFAGAVAVDNILTAIWMLITIAVPQALQRWRPRTRTVSAQAAGEAAPTFEETESVNPVGLSLLLGAGLLAMYVSDRLSAGLAGLGIAIPSILILTTLGLAWAQAPGRWRPSGAKVLGLLGVYLFLEVVGAYCDLAALGEIGRLAYDLFRLAGTLLVVHGVVVFGAGALLGWDWSLVGVASQANVGGSTSALALAKSQGRADLILPAILVGSLGNALGTYVGLLLAGAL